jgi:hypothetical protein
LILRSGGSVVLCRNAEKQISSTATPLDQLSGGFWAVEAMTKRS